MAQHIHPHIETRPVPPRTQHGPHAPRPLRARLPMVYPRPPVPQQIMATRPHTLNLALIGLQLIVGYEWLLGGVDKLLLGTFPARLDGLLAQSVSGGQLVGFFSAILQRLVEPNAVFFGYLIEWGETLAGLGLITAGLVALLRPLAERHLKGTLAGVFALGVHLLDLLAPIVAAGAGLLGLSFFFLDGLPTPWFAPSIAYGGTIDTGLFFAAASVVLLVSLLAQRRQQR